MFEIVIPQKLSCHNKRFVKKTLKAQLRRNRIALPVVQCSRSKAFVGFPKEQMLHEMKLEHLWDNSQWAA